MMNIEFTNVPIRPDWLNTALIKTKNNSIVAIDRERTEWVEEKDGSYTMLWKNVYLWETSSIYGPIYLSENRVKELLRNSVDIDFDVQEEYFEDHIGINETIDFSGVTFSV